MHDNATGYFVVMAFFRGCIIGLPISLILWGFILLFLNMAWLD